MSHDRFHAEVAREALRRLVRRGLDPTPDNYRAAWIEVMPPKPGRSAAETGECGSCGVLAGMLKLTGECVASTAIAGGWVRTEIARLLADIVPPYETDRLKDLEGPLRQVLGAEAAVRAELATAKADIKEILSTLIARIGSLADSTGDFAEITEDYARRIEKAEGIEELSKLAHGLAGDTRKVQSGLAETRRELVAAQAKAQVQDARMQDLEVQLARAREQVRTDALTGALNRRGFEEAWERESARAAREGATLSLVVLDLDDFKQLNDTHGHDAGDRALVHLVSMAKRMLRPTDVVARLGGEEFALVLPGSDAALAMTVTHRLQRALTRELFLAGAAPIFITLSAGVAVRHGEEPWHVTLKRADNALYEAKRRGKNRVIRAEAPDESPAPPETRELAAPPVAPVAPVAAAVPVPVPAPAAAAPASIAARRPLHA